MFNAIIYWALKAYFSIFFVVYLFTKFGGGDPGIWWDITGVLSLVFFLSNLIWTVAKG